MAKEISSELLNTILTRVGGPGNIASCGNCMTRLRLGVHDSFHWLIPISKRWKA